MRILIACLLLLSANFAYANCARPGVAPEIPNGATADEAGMKAGREAIQAYVNQLEAYKACLKQQADQATADVSDQQKSTWLAQGDAALDYANVLANRYSAQLKLFKERTAPPAK